MAPYLTPSELRAQASDLVDTQRFPDAVLAGLVEEFEGIAERYRGCAFTTRTVTDEIHTVGPVGGRSVVLLHPLVQAVSSLSLDGTALTGDQELNADAGILGYPDGLWAGGTVAVTYTHGHATPPSAVLRACRLYVWREAMADKNPNRSNTYSTSTPELGIVERVSSADWDAGRPTGWLDVDRILNQLPDYRVPAVA